MRTPPLFGRAATRRSAAGIMVALVAGVTIAFYFHDFINVAHHAYDLKPGDPAMNDELARESKLPLMFSAVWSWLRAA